MSTFEDLPVDIDQNEALEFHLIRAEQHLYQATQVVYTTRGPIRGFFYRWRLLKAHDIVFRLHQLEVENKRE